MANTGVTGLNLTVAGALLTNGSESATFGAAPISSVAGVPVTVTDSNTNETVYPTLYTVVQNINTIQGLSWYTQLEATNSNISGLANTLVTNWNTMFDGEGEETFSAGFDLFSGNALAITGNLTVGTVDSVTDYALSWTRDTLGGTIVSGNVIAEPKKFGTTLSVAFGYIDSANRDIAAANNLNSNLNTVTFTSFGSIMTGEFDNVTIDTTNFGQDLANTGNLISFADIQYLGYPGQLIKNLNKSGNLGPMRAKILGTEVDFNTAEKLGVSITNELLTQFRLNKTLPVSQLGLSVQDLAQSGAKLPLAFQVRLYEQFSTLTVSQVQQVKAILGVNISDIVIGKDLFDPVKIFPNSFETFTMLTSNGLRSIYLDANGTVNSLAGQFSGNLKSILPSDLASANGALSNSLQQVKNITESNSATISTSLINVESTKSLNLIEDLTSYVPSGVVDYFNNTYTVNNNISLSSGNSNTFVLSDVIGFCAGYNSAAPLQQNANLLSSLQTAGDLDDLYVNNGSSSSSTGIYPVIDYLIAGTYGAGTTITIPAGVYGAGTYTGGDFNAALANCWANGIIPAATSLASTLYSGSTDIQTVQANYRRIQEQLAREKVLHDRMDYDITTTEASDGVAFSLSENIQYYGTNNGAGGASELLERIVNYDTLGGQGIIALMRVGRNINNLRNSLVSDDLDIDDTVVDANATLLSDQYTSTDALDKIIKS